VLTRLTRDSLDHDREIGAAVSVLWASESVIYGRFGYGTAVEGADLELGRAHTALVAEAPSRGRVRIITGREARSTVPAVYAAATAGIAGTITRRAADWDWFFHDPEKWRNGYSALRFAVYELDGEARGYAVYRLKGRWEDAHPVYDARIEDLQAVDADAYAALLRFCFGIDLVGFFEMPNRRVREPLVDLLADPRRLRRRIADKIWLRLVDLPAAMAARRYGVEGSLVIDVRDDFCPWVEDVYLLEGGPDGAECEPTGRKADVSLSAADLAGAYLGDSRILARAWLGRVSGDEEAIELLHRMLAWPGGPWCSVFF
jgi:predicted acetyltransferase